jgi:LysR family transcriptional regulator, hydrogen peroxide-inducible genes activator
MELHQLRYFCAIADTGSFSRAAQNSHVSQPSLSQQIRKLEDELGARLFDRLGRSVRLNERKSYMPCSPNNMRSQGAARFHLVSSETSLFSSCATDIASARRRWRRAVGLG